MINVNKAGHKQHLKLHILHGYQTSFSLSGSFALKDDGTLSCGAYDTDFFTAVFYYHYCRMIISSPTDCARLICISL